MLTGLLLLAIENNAVSPVEDSFLQYGAIGTVALIFIAVAYKLFNNLEASNKAAMERLEAAHKAEIERIEAAHKAAIERSDSAYDNEVGRGNRLESELRDLNKLVTDKLAGELVRASDAVREAFETMHGRRQ